MFKIFKKYPNIIAAISEKKDGTMKLMGDSAIDREIIENRERFLWKLGVRDNLTVKAGLIHQNKVEVVSIGDIGKTIEGTDGLITANKNLFLTLTVADCLPIFTYDPRKEVVGLIHGGWRSLAKNILALVISEMVENFASLPRDVLVAIGPGISQCHYEVKNDLLEKFRPFLPEALKNRNEKSFLDLKKIAKTQLVNLGVKEENIKISPECTFCLSNKYFSYRREKPESFQTMLSVIGRR